MKQPAAALVPPAPLPPLLVILDLDETLIHATPQRLAREPDFVLPPYYVYQRPFAQELLAQCAEDGAVAVWTSAGRAYASAILAHLVPPTVSMAFVWTRERCTRRYLREEQGYGWLKDLDKVKRRGYALERVLMVDDIPGNVARQYGNYIRVSAYEGAEDDCELALLARYLRRFHAVPNVRTIEKRGWQAQVG